ncbi:MAG: hypothetical protein ACYTG2_17860 [Planctomycetota bacterium]|jgi:hypothetical protein
MRHGPAAGVLLACVAACAGPACGQGASPAEAAPPAALGEDEVARIDETLVLSLHDLDRYLGTVYARQPQGVAALDGLVGEALIDAAAAAQGLAVSEADVDAALAGLEAQLRAASGGERGLADSVEANVSEAQIRASLRLQVLHERLVRVALGLEDDAPVPVAELNAWIDTARAAAAVQEPPLDDPLAATWEGGELSKAAVGRRLRSILPAGDVSGVLTEMIGVLLVRRASAQAGLALTAAEATREVLERDKLLRMRSGMGDVSYEQFVQAVQKRSLEEILTSDKFGAEVLLRLLSEDRNTEEQARALWEADPGAYPGPLGVAETWEAARPIVWQALREQLYRQLFSESTIVRRF